MRQRCMLCVGVLVLLAPGLLAAQERMLRGIVVKIRAHNDKSYEETQGIPVFLQDIPSSETTDAHGRFRLALPPIFKAGEKVKLVIKHPGWGIRYPLGGEVRIPADVDKEPVEVHLLPLGSKWWWSEDQIEKFIQNMVEQAKPQLTPEGKPERVELSRLIHDWALKYGFTPQEAKAEIDKWIAAVEQWLGQNQTAIAP